MSRIPAGLDPAITRREIVFEADVASVTPFLKVATVSRDGEGHMTFASDEGANLGGLGSAPTPLMYFSVFQRRARVLTDDPGVQVRTHAQGRRRQDADARKGDVSCRGL